MGDKAIWEDLEHDPTFKRQRRVARYMIGGLINQLRGMEPFGFGSIYRKMTNEELADAAEKAAREVGIIAPPDGLHHAPACPANLWAGTDASVPALQLRSPPMTDHKPLSEGEMMLPHSTDEYETSEIRKRQHSRAQRVQAAHERDTVWCCSNEAEQCYRDLSALLQIVAATPKPLDGEALQLMSDRQTDLARLMDVTGVKNDGLSSPQQLFEHCISAIPLPALTCEATEEEAEAPVREYRLAHPDASLGIIDLRRIWAEAGLRIVKDGAPTQARPEEVFDALAEPIRQHSEQIQWQLRKGGWIIVRAAT